jgi:hypothetical protein
MRRFFPMLAALVVVMAAGLVHGLWTNRWGQSAELEEAVARLERCPIQFDGWKSKSEKIDAEALEQARAAGAWVRRFNHPQYGSFLVILMCGQGGPMSVHRPENCYRGAGYEMTSPARRASLEMTQGEEPAEYFSALFLLQEETRTVRLRIFWSWFDGQSWKAPSSPRVSFARSPALYKLYVIREMTGPEATSEEEFAKDYLRRLLPRLSQALTPP